MSVVTIYHAYAQQRRIRRKRAMAAHSRVHPLEVVPEAIRPHTQRLLQERQAIGSKQHQRTLDQALSQIRIPKTLYHVAPSDRIPSILKNGLMLGQSRSTQGGKIRGVYLTDDPHGLGRQDTPIRDGVIIPVKTQGLDLHLDPEFYPDFTDESDVPELVRELGDGGIYVFSTRPIPPSFLGKVRRV